MPTLKQKLSYLILGQKGGQNRIQMIDLLKQRPYNLNQMAEILGLNYRTIKHHAEILLKNELISTSRTGGYGEVYFLSPDMEGNMQLFEDIVDKFKTSKKLTDFTSSPKFYRSVMEQTNDAIVIIDKEGKTFFWNKSAESLYGYKKEEIVGDTIQIFPDSGTQEEMIKKVANGELIVGFESKLKHESGKLIDVSLTMDAIKDENDKIIGFSVLSRDITKREQAIEALKFSEERYALAQRGANIGSWDWDIRTSGLHWSDRIEPMFGFGSGEFGATYEAFLQRVHPEDRQYVTESVNACVEEGKDYAIEHRIIWPDGTVRWVSETGDVIRDENGKAIRMLGVVQDITEHKRAEERIRYLNGLLMAIKDISQLMGHKSDLGVLMQKSCDMLLETRDYLDIYIALLDDEKGVIVPVGHSGDHQRKRWEIASNGKGKAPKCVKSVLESASTKRINSTIEYCQKCKYCKHADDHQSIVIPMLSQKSVVGIMFVCFEAGHKIDEEEIRLLEEVANDLAFARAKIRAETELQASEEKYRVAFNTSPDLFYRISPEGKILDCNDTAIKTLGYSRDELIGMPLFNIYAEESKPYAKECFKEWQKTGKLRVKELKIVTKDGRKIDIELNVNTIYDSKGNVVSSISTQRDVTKRKRAEEALLKRGEISPPH